MATHPGRLIDPAQVPAKEEAGGGLTEQSQLGPVVGLWVDVQCRLPLIPYPGALYDDRGHEILDPYVPWTRCAEGEPGAACSCDGVTRGPFCSSLN